MVINFSNNILQENEGGEERKREREKKINRRSEREQKLADPVCVIDSMRFHEKSNLTIGVMSEKPLIFISRQLVSRKYWRIGSVKY